MTTDPIDPWPLGVDAAARWTVAKHAASALVLGIGVTYLSLQTTPSRVAGNGRTTDAVHVDGAGGHAGVWHSEDAAGSDGAADKRPATILNVLSCTPLPHVEGKSVTTALVTFPPDSHTPAHRHPGSVTAFVLKGSIRSQMEGEAPRVYPQGSTWFEAPRALHVFAENTSATEPAELLAVFVADTDCGPLVIPE